MNLPSTFWRTVDALTEDRMWLLIHHDEVMATLYVMENNEEYLFEFDSENDIWVCKGRCDQSLVHHTYKKLEMNI